MFDEIRMETLLIFFNISNKFFSFSCEDSELYSLIKIALYVL
jgi:hypothetical protein